MLLHEAPRPTRLCESHIFDPAKRDDAEAVVGKEDVDVVNPNVAALFERFDDDMLSVSRQAGQLVFSITADHAGCCRMHDDRVRRQLLRLFRRRQDEGIRTINGNIHIEHAERIANHPRLQVPLHSQGSLHGGFRVPCRICTHVKCYAAKILTRHIVFMDVARGPGRIGS